MRVQRAFLLAAIGSALVSLGACTTAPESRNDVLDARLAGPCQRLILSWPENASRLRALVGDDFEPSISDGVGALQLSVLQCGLPGARQLPLTFAYLSVPISADSVPVVITGIPNDGWLWLPFVIVDTESSRVFAAMGYDTEVAEIELDVDSTTNGSLIAAQLTFDTGRIWITAGPLGEDHTYTTQAALVSEDARYHSLFFGRETAERHRSPTVDIETQGTTPLSAVDFQSQAESAVVDTELLLDRIYWRLPRSRP